MDVLIHLDREKPPAGTVLAIRDEMRPAVGPGSALAFTGWLGLLRALAEVVDEGADADD